MFTLKRKQVSASVLSIGMCVCVFGQAQHSKRRADSEAVKVQHNQFTGERTISFEPRLILDRRDQRMSLSAEARLGGNRTRRDISDLDDKVTLTFSSLSAAGIEFGDRELHFLVDGARVRIGKASPRMPRASGNPNLPVSGHMMIVLSLNKLQQIARGGDVRMRLGPVELTLDEGVMNVLKEFAAACSHQNNERK